MLKISVGDTFELDSNNPAGWLQKDIASIVELDARRVSDILTGKRDENGRIAKHKAFGG